MFFLVFEESYLMSFLPFVMTIGRDEKEGSNCVEGNKKFGVFFLVFFFFTIFLITNSLNFSFLVQNLMISYT